MGFPACHVAFVIVRNENVCVEANLGSGRQEFALKIEACSVH